MTTPTNPKLATYHYVERWELDDDGDVLEVTTRRVTPDEIKAAYNAGLVRIRYGHGDHASRALGVHLQGDDVPQEGDGDEMMSNDWWSVTPKHLAKVYALTGQEYDMGESF